MTVTEVVLGLDLGTTSSKALVRDLVGREVALASARTPWATVQGGTETTAPAMLVSALDLLNRAVRTTEERIGPIQVVGVGIAGLGESGVLLDARGEPCAPVIAWFDKRGTQEVARLGNRTAGLPEQFARRTGLPWDSQASLAKLLWLQSAGHPLTAAHRWCSVPEWVVHRLGGTLVREPSLAARTGLVDQATGSVWEAGLRAAGLPLTLLPPPLTAGTAAGSLCHVGLPSALQGAALTVAGHDHPVAAVGVGAAGPDELFNSSGTADVVARSLPGVLDDDRRALLVRSGLSVGAHVLPDTSLVLGGARGGLLLRRVLCALGAVSAPERERLDLAALAVEDLPLGLEVSGAGPTGDDVVLRMRDDVSPAHIWAAATRYTAAATGTLIATIEAVVGPHRRAIACGGWTRMDSVRAAKRSAIANLEFSVLREPGAVGAALLAAQAAGVIPATNCPGDVLHDHPISAIPGGDA
ncbi:MAG TPA: FGGY family carbohydrate kinase [Pseudonocardia sp.]